MLCYNSHIRFSATNTSGAAMSQTSLRPDAMPILEAGRPAVVVIRPSLLRLGLAARLSGAACFVAAIWILIVWVLR